MTSIPRGQSLHSRALCFAGLILAALAGHQLRADEGDPEFTAIRVGFGDYYKVGHWTPVELTIRGGRDAITGFVTVTVPDGDGARATVRSERAHQILPGQQTRVVLYVKPGRLDSDFEVRLFDGPPEAGDQVVRDEFTTRFEPDIEHPRQALQATEELIAGLGPAIGIEAAISGRNANQQPEYESHYCTIRGAADLPTRWYGYDGLDYLILSTSQPELYNALTANSAQLAALKQWVRMGGRLVLSVGSKADQIIGPGAPLADFVPGSYAGLKPVRPGRAFESYISASEPLPESRRGDAGDHRLQVPQLTDVRGHIEIRESGDLPLAIRAPFGFGEVLFVGVELDEPPFARWSQRSRLVARLLGFGENQQPARQRNNMLGFNDLSGQLRAGLDEFTGVKIAPFALVAVLILAYIVLIGPVDYLLVKKIFKRMEFTWFTFPTMVAAVTGGAYCLAYWMKGEALLVNQVEVVDVDLAGHDPAAPMMRGTSWVNVFSPQMRTYDVGIDPKPAVAAKSPPERLVSWMGLPGAGFGGMNQMAADPPLFSRAYGYTPDLSEMLGVPIQVWSTKCLTTRWNAAAAAGLAIEAGLVSGGRDALEGRITNRLKVPLTDCLLAFGNSGYRIGDLAPGQEAVIQPVLRRRLADELSVRRGNPPAVAVNSPVATWNAGNRDVPAVVEQMMFFTATGGWNGTGLDNRHLRYVDLSNHLTMEQAILVGRCRQSAAPIRLDGTVAANVNNRQWTMYRFLLPVQTKQK